MSQSTFLPDTSVEPFASRRLHWMNMLALHATDRPDEIAITAGDQNWSWGQMHEQVQSIAAGLEERGIGFGDRVLILALNSAEFIMSLLAVNTLGAIAAPLNIRSVPRELDYYIEDSGAKLILVDAIGAQTLAGATQEIDSLRLDVDIPELAKAGRTPTPVDVDENTVALIVYTSGTTSDPKGVMLTYINQLSQLIPVYRAALPEGSFTEVTLILLPLFHIAGIGMIPPSIFGGTRMVVAPANLMQDIGALVDVIEKEQVTTLFIVPTLLHVLCHFPGIAERKLPLTSIAWGASPASKETLEAASRIFPDANITAAFGQTEMSPVTCQLFHADSLRKMGSVGKPIGPVAVRVVDAEGKDVGVGEIGEVIYRGPGLMAGYWNKPEMTREATHDGWFHSGDLVVRDEEGFMFVVDRAKDIIISGGENISSIELEHAVVTHPKVADASVVGVPHDLWVETPMAVVVPTDPADPPTLEEIRDFLSDKLASFKRPTQLTIVEELPRNASGKLQKHKIRDMLR